MRKTKPIVSVFLFLIPAMLSAKSIPHHFPQDLIYHHKAIDPLCFFEMEKSKESVSLEDCGIHKLPHRKITGKDTDLLNEGFYGFDYSFQDNESNDKVTNCYSYYKAIGESYGYPLIYSLNNTGGSGQFSAITLVKRDENTLTLKPIIFGDRCNGGIIDAEQKGEKLIYSISITPADLYDLAKEKSTKLKPENDLAACAACCIGTATLAVNPAHDSKDRELISMSLNKKINEAISNSKAIYQACFNTLLAAYQDGGQFNLTPQELHEFLTQFSTRCTK